MANDLAYSVRVQDRDLKRLAPILRQVRRELQQVNTTSTTTGRVADRSFRTAARSANHAKREVEQFARGTIAGSMAFRSFARTVAFSSLAFLGGTSIVRLGEDIVKSGMEAERSAKRLQAQFAANGLELSRYKSRVHDVIEAQSMLAGIDDELAQDSFTTLLRGTKNVNAALKLNAVALDVAAGRGMDAVAAGQLLAKVYAGNVGILSRYGIQLKKGTPPLQALIELQRRFAGQAQAAGDSAEGSIGRFQLAWKNLKEAVGEGILPGLSRTANRWARDLADPATLKRAQEIGRTISHDVGDGLQRAGQLARDAWPTVKLLLQGGAMAAVVLGDALHVVSGALEIIAKITPGGSNTLVMLIAGGLLLRGTTRLATRLALIGPAAEVGAAGAGSALTRFRLGPLAATLKSALRLRNLLVVGAGIALGEAIHKSPFAAPFNAIGGFLGSKAFDALHKVAPGFATSLADHAGPAMKGAADAGLSAGAAKAAEKAKALFGANLKDLPLINETKVKAQLARLKSAADDAFQRVDDKLLSAFDARTDAIAARLIAVVHLGRATFRVSVSGKTPAERELDALDRLQARRSLGRDLRDARENLQLAKRIGDPKMIREATEKVGDAELAIRRNHLEQRAKLERTAANTALQRADKEFRARRDLMREHMADELAALRKRLAAGKLAEAQAKNEILGIMRRYGVSLQGAGRDLGSAFIVGLDESLGATLKAATQLTAALAGGRRRRRATGRADQPGARWAGQTFTTRAAIAAWLEAHGSSYARWARNHPDAAGRLTGPLPPHARRRVPPVPTSPWTTFPAGGRGGDTYITVHGSIVTEDQIAETVTKRQRAKVRKALRQHRGPRRNQGALGTN